MGSCRWLRPLAVASALSALGCGDSSSSDVAQSRPTNESWLVGMYMAADNNLDPSASADINEMLRAGVPENVTVLILVDRAELGEYGDFPEIQGLEPHSSAKWLQITSEGLEELEDLGEIDTTDPATVRMFVQRLAKQPAQNKAVIFWDHGGSFSFGSDDSARRSRSMAVADIAAQFRVDPRDEGRGYERFDLVGFDACLMSSLESLAEFQPITPIYVGSAELEPGDGWDYKAFFQYIGRTPALTPKLLASAIVDGYVDYYEANPKRAGGLRVTQAAWSTDADAVIKAYGDLTSAYEHASGSEAGSYQMVADLYSAQAKSTFYARSTESPSEQTSWMDVGDFLVYHAESRDEQVAQAAEELRRALSELRLFGRTDGRADSVLGLSVYFPINLVGRNSGATDAASRSLEDSRLFDEGYRGVLKLIDASDASSLVGALRARDAQQPQLSFEIGGVSAGEVSAKVMASDDVMIVRAEAALLYETDDGDSLAVIDTNPGDIGVKELDVEGSLPLRAVLLGPDGVTASADSVGFLKRVRGDDSVPVATRQGQREARGLLLLGEDHAIAGVALQSENGNWATLAWEDLADMPDVEIAPLSYTVDSSTGEYSAHAGGFTAAKELRLRAVELEETARLSVVVAVTDIAGNTVLKTNALPE